MRMAKIHANFAHANKNLTKEAQRLGDESGLVKPLPIPNREVKRPSANGSWGLSPSESRLSPRLCASFFIDLYR